ncbi:MAG: hypothetical protein KC613_24565, partial [Myxococcales bacterium]|nr:hypothetical protein [Myxococcales bacterium]
ADGDALALQSLAYGEAANRIAVQVLAGDAGYDVVVEADGARVEGDEIGAEPLLVIGYDGEASMGLVLDTAGLDLFFRRALPAAPVTAAHNGGVVRVRSTFAGDVGQRVSVFGVDADDAPIFETVTLNGLTVVSTVQSFKAVTGLKVFGLTVGDVTADDTEANVAFTVGGPLAGPWTPGIAKLVSASAADVGQRATVVGKDVGGARVTEAVILNGLTEVATTKAFAQFLEIHLDGPTVGAVSVLDSGDVAALVIPGGTTDADGTTAGLYVPETLPVHGAIGVFLSAAPVGAPYVVLRGVSTTGVALALRVLASDVEAVTTALFGRLDQVELGQLEAGSELNLRGSAFTAVGSTPLREVADKISRLAGFRAGLQRIAGGGLPVATLDHGGLTDIKSTDAQLRAALHDLVAWFNDNPTGLSAARAAGAVTPPSPMPAAQFLVGGGEGVTTADDWAAAFDALRAYRDVIVVPLSTNAAVHAQLRAHVRRMEADRIGADERNGYVGLGLDRSREAITADILALNDRNVGAAAQAITLRDPVTGSLREYGPEYLAVLLAAMQAGTPVGEAQSWKRPNVVRFRQHSSWNPMDYAEAMLEAGLMFLRDGEKGVIVERAVTTYRANDAIFTEVGPNEAANESVKRARRRLQAFTGERAFDGKASTMRSVLIAELQEQLTEGLLAAFDPEATTVANRGDGFAFGYRGTPVPTLNFINLTFFASAA